VAKKAGYCNRMPAVDWRANTTLDTMAPAGPGVGQTPSPGQTPQSFRGMERIVMKALLAIALGALVAVGGIGCASTAEKMSAKSVSKAFAQKSPTCKWTAGNQKGQDFYYTTSTNGGEMDRNIGSLTMQGTWRVNGDQLCVNFGKESCYGVSKGEGKKAYVLHRSDGSVDMNMKC